MTIPEERYYKILNRDGSCIVGVGSWPMPQDGKPGEWLGPIEGELVPCKHGLHLCRIEDLPLWLKGEYAVYEAEPKGAILASKDKVVVREARLLKRLTWNKNSAAALAVDYAERVLPIYESRYPEDNRPRKAIEAARSCIAPGAYTADTSAAAEAALDAADDATSFVATYAAYAAAEAGDAADMGYVGLVASDAAFAGAFAAADIGRDAAWQREVKWQRQRLLAYLYSEVAP